MHPQARAFVEQQVDRLALNQAGLRVVEFGSRNVNGEVRDLFDRVDRYWGIDPMPGPGVDEVIRAEQFGANAQADEDYDVVVCCEVLEHMEFFVALVAAGGRVLKRGGVFLITCAMDPRAPHSITAELWDESEYYENVEPWLLRAALETYDFRIDVVEVDPEAGDLRVVAVKG